MTTKNIEIPTKISRTPQDQQSEIMEDYNLKHNSLIYTEREEFILHVLNT